MTESQLPKICDRGEGGRGGVGLLVGGKPVNQNLTSKYLGGGGGQRSVWGGVYPPPQLACLSVSTSLVSAVLAFLRYRYLLYFIDTRYCCLQISRTDTDADTN